MALTSGRVAAKRFAAVALTAGMTAAAVMTYLAYTASFTPVESVTVTADRAGLVMDRDAKVKYLGVQVGTVSDIAFDGAQARLTLKILRSQMDFIPANAPVRIVSNTVFGAKSVDFLAPEHPSQDALAPNSSLHATDVGVEVNTLFQTLVDTLHKIDPVELNATLSAISEGLRNNGRDLGATLAGANNLLGKLNPVLPTLHADLQKLGVVAADYADAAPDLATILTNAPTIARTLTDQQSELSSTLLATTGLATSAADTLEPAEDDLVAAVQRLRVPLTVLSDYSPEFGCLVDALSGAAKKFGDAVGVAVPGLFLNANFKPGVPAYTYPESLPTVNASGGPNCRGLPNLPTKQGSGSWYRPPFLVTDNAYIPYQPNTELQFDAPNTLQFLFNGAFAERDDF
ncbi:MCE family protein [Mycolicibacterium fluoranthenivorans]|uniref:MCE family protein n=1 Tax=Mycolicibacterium fluoranthenivorans TaxID=258505 RepID=UPI0038B38014